MAYAEKRDGKLTGWWYGEKRMKDGKTFRRRFEKKKDAEGYEVYVGLMGCEPPTLEGATTGRTFTQVAEECRVHGGPKGVWRAGRDPSTLARLAVVAGIIGHVDIAAVTTQTLDTVVSTLRKRRIGGKPLTDATINRYLHAASAVLTFAVDRRYILVKPKTPAAKERSAKRGILSTFDQEDAILGAMRSAGRELEAFCCEVLVTSGIRKSELWKLKPYQIDDDHINLEGDQTKMEEARRVYIGAEMAKRLRVLIAANGLPKMDQLLKHFKAGVKACGYAENILIHSLRHTRNTRLRKAGVDIKIRMQMLGHKSVATSMRYDHIDDADQLEAAKKVEAARGEPKKSSAVVQISKLVSL